MKTKTISLWLAALWLAGGVAAWAHDPLQAYSEAWVRADHMELKFTLSRISAARLLRDDPKSAEALPVFDVENFDRFVAPLKKAGESIYAITAGGAALAPSAVDVRLTEELDVELLIIYPRPAVGPMELTAAYLKKLPDDGYGTNLAVFDEGRQQLAYADNLNLENPSITAKIGPVSNGKPLSAAGSVPPAPPPMAAAALPDATSPTAPVAAPVPLAGQAASPPSHSRALALGLTGLLALVGAAWWAWRRFSRT